MMTALTFGQARRRLALLWASGALVIGGLLLLQHMGGVYGSRVGEMWAWFSFTIVPIISAIVFTIAEARQPASGKAVGSGKYGSARALSAVYLAFVFVSMFMFDDPNRTLEFLPTAHGVASVVQALLLVSLRPFFATN